MTITLLSFVILAITTHQICATEVASIECGTSNSTGMQWNDKITNRGEWPFLAALFNVKENDFFCGGTLISSKHVLTAAHCTQEKSSWKKLLPVDIRVHLGGYNLLSNTEIGVQRANVQEIHVHPEWDVYSFRHDADLAILLLTDVVLFTDYIRPVCIPADDIVIHDVRGSVVGWGLTRIGTKPSTEFIKRTLVTGINSNDCLTEDPSAALISSSRTFCGRNKGRDPNKGDLGGGFYVQNKDFVWVQHGIVSSLSNNLTDSVVVYTNVQMFKNWIVDTIRQSGATVGEAKTEFVKPNLKCVFQGGQFFAGYTCSIDNLNVRCDNVAMASFSGSHQSQKTDQDVAEITFRNGTMFFIPSGVGLHFKNVKRIRIGSGLSTKGIQRSDFKSFENLIDLKIFGNDITTLDYDSFRDLQQLQWFALMNNKLTEIDDRTFERNVGLISVDLYNSKLEFLPRHLFRNNRLLTYVNLDYNSLEIIDESTFATNDKLKEVNLSRNKIEVLPKHLFRNNLLLDRVYLSDNSLKTIDGSIFETNIKLVRIRLDGNKLEVLPRNVFRNNSLLEFVDLSNNTLKMIYATTFETNIYLRQVPLQGNNLEVLPTPLFRNNTLLEYIDLSSNTLKIIDGTTFETNIYLDYIRLQGNKLEVLPRHLFSNNRLLRSVDLGFNSLEIIDESTFATNDKLEEVILSRNKIEDLPKHLFRNNLVLERVYLSDNSLKTIDGSTFETNINIVQVYLDGNKLEVLPKHLFQNNSLLELLDLGNNSLEIFDESTFETNVKLREVRLHGNNKLVDLPRTTSKIIRF